MDRYSVVVRWSDEDESYIAEIPELKWVKADGETREEAIGQLKEVFDIYVENYDGELPPPKAVVQYSGQLRLRMPPSLHERLAFGASAEGVSLNQYMLLLLQREHTVRQAARELVDAAARRHAEFERAALDAAQSPSAPDDDWELTERSSSAA